jgi:hypothetical protein
MICWSDAQSRESANTKIASISTLEKSRVLELLYSSSVSLRKGVVSWLSLIISPGVTLSC